MTNAVLNSVVDVYYGVPIEDPFRWLEDAGSFEVHAWTQQQRAIFRDYMDASEKRPLILRRVEEMLMVDTVDVPWQIGPKIFYMRRLGNQQQPCLVVSEAGVDKVLLDPNDAGGNHMRSLHILQVSNDGRVLALGEKSGGEDSCRIVFLDAETRRLQPVTIPQGFHRGIAFGNGNRHVFHAHERLQDRTADRVVYKLDLLTGEELEIFNAGDGPLLRVSVLPGTDMNWVGYRVQDKGKPDTLYLHNEASGNPPRRINGPEHKGFRLIRVGARCWATMPNANGTLQVLSFDPHHPEPERWDVVLSEAPQNMNDCIIWGEFICITCVEGKRHFTRVYNFEGKEVDEVEYPEGGTLLIYPRKNPVQEGIYYSFSSFGCPPIVKKYNLLERKHNLFAVQRVPGLSNRIEMRDSVYPSVNGQQIPICIAWDPERVLSVPAPLILTAYGGFGAKLTPAYSTFVSLLMQLGLRFAFANVRGGGEFGADWYEAGRRRNKPTAISDFVCAAEWLVSEQLTTAPQLGAFGGCAGGLLVAAAVNRRPELFRAVLLMSALMDMLRYHLFDRTVRWIEGEYGSVDVKEDFEVLRTYSPYHGILRGASYPAILLASGETDERCNPLHIRKMAARLHADTACSNPVLVDINPHRGHSPHMPLSVRAETLADRITFFCDQLEVNLPLEFRRSLPEAPVNHEQASGRYDL
jgi:prolyl oligopeptidase